MSVVVALVACGAGDKNVTSCGADADCDSGVCIDNKSYETCSRQTDCAAAYCVNKAHADTTVAVCSTDAAFRTCTDDAACAALVVTACEAAHCVGDTGAKACAVQALPDATGCDQDVVGEAADEVSDAEGSSTGLKNGDFSQGLAYWTASGGLGSHISFPTSVVYKTSDCLPSQDGNPFLSIDSYGVNGYVQQTFTVPPNATTLSLRTWNNLDPVQVTISVVAGEQTTVLEAFQPPSLEALSNPADYYSVICTFNDPATRSYPIDGFQGQQVTLQLGSSYVSGINGTIGNFDDVAVR
jgi:hypothetical protein